MGKNSKKKFIDKKNAVTFHLVHRSQKDPLLVDENAPQHVLKPINTGSSKDKEKRIEEQHKYGIYFDDEYDYLQHLRGSDENQVVMEKVYIPAKKTNEPRDRNDASSSVSLVSPGPSIQLPSSVFESHVEERVGLLNKAAPVSGLRLDLDPDIVAAMDEDFDFDDPSNQLEDDFIALANAEGGSDYDPEEDEDYQDISSDFDEDNSENDDDEDDDEFDENDKRMKMFLGEETKSRFTEYSMSSSVMKRNDNLSYLDDTFEQMFAKYDDNEIGALECEDIEGEILTNDERLLKVAEEFQKECQLEKFNTEKSTNKYGTIQEETESSDNDSTGDEYERMIIKEKEKWDCESILSTYSNIYNHPTLITEPRSDRIKINPKTGLPMTRVSNKLTPGLLAQLEDEAPAMRGPGSVISAISTLSIRPKDESPEERKARKKSLKDFRKERRIEKKMNKLAFKDEKKRVEKEFIHKKIQSSAMHL